jgi:hypothetical protein
MKGTPAASGWGFQRVEVAGVLRPIPASAGGNANKRPPCGGPLVCIGGGGGSTQANPGLRPSGHLLRKCSLRHPAYAVEPFGFASRPAPAAMQTKRLPCGSPFVHIGGGGGSRTRVRRRLTPSTTCLAHRSISSSGSTACETHRLTSLKSFALLPSDGGIRLSHDNDGTSTSIGTSGFPAYALSGECVVVVVGN